ncbi:MAG TPA: septation protein IspZ, partial [Rhizomicrobium sp.]|nr:septation protein IspZ [Rhizomicrobium sp.]
MKELLHSARALLHDMASTLLFFALYALTGNIIVSVAAGIVLSLAQIGWQLAHGKPVEALQWISLVAVMASGATTLATKNALFVTLEPSLIYVLVGLAMLKRGWMLRYLPAIAIETVPDLVIGFGYVWAGLMFFSAVLNLGLALALSVMSWGAVMSAWATGSKIALFFIQYATMKTIGRRRYRAKQGSGQDML